MWISLKRMEEEDLIFMNSICYFSCFWSFQETSRPSTKTSEHIGSSLQTHGMLGKATH